MVNLSLFRVQRLIVPLSILLSIFAGFYFFYKNNNLNLQQGIQKYNPYRVSPSVVLVTVTTTETIENYNTITHTEISTSIEIKENEVKTVYECSITPVSDISENHHSDIDNIENVIDSSANKNNEENNKENESKEESNNESNANKIENDKPKIDLTSDIPTCDYKERDEKIANLTAYKDNLKLFVIDYWNEIRLRVGSETYQNIIRPIARKKLASEYPKRIKPIEISADKSNDEDYDQPSGKKIALLTVSNYISASDEPIKDYEKRVRENRNAYCAYHGYQCIFLNVTDFPIFERGPTWSKVSASKYVFEKYPDVEWIWNLDADIILMTPQISLARHILAPSVLKNRIMCDTEYIVWQSLFTAARTPRCLDMNVKKVDLIIANDFNGLNTGSFFLRRSSFTDWLLTIWDDTDDRYFPEDGLHEQFFLNVLLLASTYIQRHTAIVPQRLINAFDRPPIPSVDVQEYGIYQDNDFLVHFAGCRTRNNCGARFDAMWDRRKTIESVKAEAQLPNDDSVIIDSGKIPD